MNLFFWRKKKEPEQLISPYVIVTHIDENEKCTVDVNGITFMEEEKIQVKYYPDNNWGTGTLLKRNYSTDADGWVVMDSYYDTRPLSWMSAIRKKTESN